MVKGSTPPPAAAGAVTQRATAASKVILLCLAAAATAPMGAALAATAIPGTIEAEWFDSGGEGPGYHELTPTNTGGKYRPNEGVDIRDDVNHQSFIVTNFETGEWLAYTIDVAASGYYGWGLRASSAFAGSSYYLVLDGKNVTGPVAVPNTGNWDVFRWVAAPNVWLSQGRHVLKVVSARQYFDLDLIVIFALPAPPPPTPGVDLACMFSAPHCGLEEQAKVPGRASLTTISRDGGTGLRLHTEPGDTNVAYSTGTMERDDVYLAKPGTSNPEVYGEGVEQWWAHSILFPDDFVVPTTQAYAVFDFHNTGGGHNQANFNLAFRVQADVTQPASLSFFGYGGADIGYAAVIGQIHKNVWYDFVYHVRWSSGPDGFFRGWVNGKL